MKNKFLVLSLSLTILLAGTGVVYAQRQQGSGTFSPQGSGASNTQGSGTFQEQGSGTNTGCGGGTGILPNPFKGGCSLYALLEAIIENILLPIGAVLAVLAFIYSGFLYVTAQGNQTKIATAHRSLLYSAIGTAVLLGAWAIAKVIQGTIGNILNS